MQIIDTVKKYPYVAAGVALGVVVLVSRSGGSSYDPKKDPRFLLQSIKEQEATKRRAIAADVHKQSLVTGSQSLQARIQAGTAATAIRAQSAAQSQQTQLQNKYIDYSHQEFKENLDATVKNLPLTYKQQVTLAEIGKERAIKIAEESAKAGIIAAKGQAKYLGSKGNQGWLGSIGGLLGDVGDFFGGLF